MPTHHLSLRVESDTLERLEAQSRQTGQSRSGLAKVLLDEGLRMAAYPGIVFRSGPAGRRPGLAGGPDLWEIVRVFQGLDVKGDQALHQLAELTALGLEQVRIALQYYAEYRDEVDEWIRRVDAEASQAEAAWHRARRLLGE